LPIGRDYAAVSERIETALRAHSSPEADSGEGILPSFIDCGSIADGMSDDLVASCRDSVESFVFPSTDELRLRWLLFRDSVVGRCSSGRCDPSAFPSIEIRFGEGHRAVVSDYRLGSGLIVSGPSAQGSLIGWKLEGCCSGAWTLLDSHPSSRVVCDGLPHLTDFRLAPIQSFKSIRLSPFGRNRAP
jgi:hypothetical protein